MQPELISHIQSIREQGFQKATRSYVYNDQRPLEPTRIIPSSYEKLAPHWKKLSLIHLIEHKRKEAQEHDTTLSILDAGCGPFAVCLRDIKERWPEIACFGVNAEIADRNIRSFQTHDHIQVTRGDIQNIHTLFPQNSMDIVTSVKVFPYLADPFMTIVGIYEVLKPGGVALITDVPITPIIPELKHDEAKYARFINHLTSLGMEVRDRMTAHRYHLHMECDISFEKTTPHLVLPLTYTGNVLEQTVTLHDSGNPDLDTYWYKSVECRFVEHAHACATTGNMI